MRISDWSSDVCSSDLVARRARGQQFGKLCARGTVGDRLPRGFDLLQHRFDGFAVACVRHRFGAPAAAVFMDLDDHRLGRMLDSARDAERRGQRPAAMARAQLAKHDCSRSAMRAMPMVTGSWQGSPSASSIPAQARAAASAPPRFEVFTATPTAMTRAEEHPSELQSLMRISYAVFCLKKKKKPTKTLI